MKKILSLLSFLILFMSVDTFAQGTTMTIGTAAAQPGQPVSVPINVTNFRNVGSISLKISYTTSVMTFDTLLNYPAGTLYNAAGGVLTIGWFDLQGNTLNTGTGTLLNMRFRFISGSSPVSFITAQCVISDSLGNTIPVTFNNGAVTPAPSVTLTIGTVSGTAGQPVNVPITTQGFNKIGAVQLKITFGSPNIAFVDTVNAFATFTRSVVGNVITLVWVDFSGLGKTIPPGGKLVDLRFNYTNGTGNITFNNAECEIADSAGNLLTVAYVNGRVQPAGTLPITVSVPNIVQSKTSLVVPLNVTNFNNIGALTFKLSYNGAALTYNSLSQTPRTGFSANQSGGVLTIAWVDFSGTQPLNLGSTRLLNINFTYTNVGNIPITFLAAQCEVADSLGTILSNTTYTNGSVSQGGGWTDQVFPTAASARIYTVKTVDANVAWAGGTAGRVQRTTDGGNTWTLLPADTALGTTNIIYAIEALDATTAWVTTSPSGSSSIFRTTNGGTSWTRQFTQTNAAAFIDAIKMFDANNGFALGDPVPAGGRITILRTSNGGGTWVRDTVNAPTALNSSETPLNNSMCVVGTSNATAYIWLGTTAGRVVRTLNGGTTWTASTPFASTVAVVSVWFNANISFGVAGSNSTAAGAVRTTDGGTTWTPLTPAMPGTGSITGISGAVYDFFACRGAFVYRSTDRGLTWAQTYYSGLSTGVGTMSHLSFAAQGVATTNGWAVTTTGGITSFSGILTDVDEPGSQVPTEFAVMQNYPNPFNPSTTIRYALPKDARITLAVYNVLGQKVAELRNEVQNVGYHEAVWNGTNAAGTQVSSGIYIYRLEANPVNGSNSFTSFMKMLLLK